MKMLSITQGSSAGPLHLMHISISKSGSAIVPQPITLFYVKSTVGASLVRGSYVKNTSGCYDIVSAHVPGDGVIPKVQSKKVGCISYAFSVKKSILVF